MKSIFLAGINARFNHVNLAVLSIASYVRLHALSYGKHTPDGFVLQTGAFTINEPILQILRGIASAKPDVILLSVYIWNSDIVFKLIPELHKILPDSLIGAGGPEVSFRPDVLLSRFPSLDFVVAGEGEQTVTEICDAVSAQRSGRDSVYELIRKIPGVWTRVVSGSAILGAGPRSLFKSLDDLPFPYDNGSGGLVSGVDAQNSIIYYESSRGCPFNCSYCLSSVDKTVRFSSLDRVYHDLQFFLDNQVTLVKFVDRTFNLNENRVVAIWRYIYEHWNNRTTFHFEIAAQQLSDMMLDAIQTVPVGMMQFEIGIQSTNPPTLEQVGRSADLNRISSVLSRIPKTIHVHLDLIAGLPFESPVEFEQSFDYTIARRPQMLQFGFLKILNGTAMEAYALKTDKYAWLSIPPYEVLQSPWVTYDQMQHYKDIEEVLDVYYNSQNFLAVMSFLNGRADRKLITMYAFFEDLVRWFFEQGLTGLPHKVIDEFRFLYDFFNAVHDRTFLCKSSLSSLPDTDFDILYELLRFDFIRREKPGTFPAWYVRRYDKNAHRAALDQYVKLSVREAFSLSSYESFSLNPLLTDPVVNGKSYSLLFIYAFHHSGASSKTGLHSRDTKCILLE